MPELPEVETVLRTLETQIKDEVIQEVIVLYKNIIVGDTTDFCNTLKNESFKAFKRRGKYLIFEMNKVALVSHLRMEGKYFIGDDKMPIDKHTHVIFKFKSGKVLHYHDVRKFGRMEIISKQEDYDDFFGLGLEPFSKKLDLNYVKDYLRKKKLPIKQLLLDQSFIAGIGNIYANEILFACNLHPLTPANILSEEKMQILIEKTRHILKQAIDMGGTTIRSYTSSLGVTGRFQQVLNVHNQSYCPVCHTKIEKIFVAQRGTYFCPKCQTLKKRVAITGTIGSGKSTVSKILKEKSYPVFDADQEVFLLQQKGEIGYLKIKEAFADCFDGDELNRAKLANIIFNDPLKKKELEAIMHPLVKERMFMAMDKRELFFAEIPLLFEAHFDQYFDEILVVYANQKVTLERLRKRGLSLKEAKERIRSQMPSKEKIERATSVIYNNGTLDDLKLSVEKWLKEIC